MTTARIKGDNLRICMPDGDIEHVGYKWDGHNPEAGWGKTNAGVWARCDGSAGVWLQDNGTWLGVTSGFKTEGHESAADAMDAIDKHIDENDRNEGEA